MATWALCLKACVRRARWPGWLRRRGRAVRDADGAEMDAEEVAEDIYEGLGGEAGDLRPGKPEPVRCARFAFARLGVSRCGSLQLIGRLGRASAGGASAG